MGLPKMRKKAYSVARLSKPVRLKKFKMPRYKGLPRRRKLKFK